MTNTKKTKYFLTSKERKILTFLTVRITKQANKMFLKKDKTENINFTLD